MPERPYFQLSINDLELLCDANERDAAVLGALQYELRIRQTKRARQLLQRVTALQAIGAQTPNGSEVGESPQVTLGWAFDPQQLEIVRGHVDWRVLVNSPPGTGKTAVACGRIAFLLEQGIPPHQIWLVSFTRTAVHELRNRIKDQAGQRADVFGVKVATLDSRAWHLVQGFEGRGGDVLRGGHQATIRDATRIIHEGGDAVDEAFDELSHLIIDEAQDIVGDRALLVEEIIARAPPNCGITIFADDAQAIYGFSEEDDLPPDSSGTLPERIREMRSDFVEKTLSRVYRTSSANLKRIFVDVRTTLLEKLDRSPARAANYMHDQIRNLADSQAVLPRDGGCEDGRLVLYRTRFEVLNESAYLTGVGQLHRIRMSGMPVCLHPWIALALGAHTGRRLPRDVFRGYWERVKAKLGGLAPDVDSAWSEMARYSGDERSIDTAALRDVLARPRPPIEFVANELGLSGPILSTIHASKGREAPSVSLMLPSSEFEGDDSGEEARVLFVGATRARLDLAIGEGSSRPTRKTDTTGRRCSWTRDTAGGWKRARVEVGLQSDCEDTSPVSRSVQASESAALATQSWLSDRCLRVEKLRLWAGVPEDEYRYLLRAGESKEAPVLARFTTRFNADLFDVAKILWPDLGTRLKPPPYIDPVFLVGVRSVVLEAESNKTSELHGVWAGSGIWLAPVVVGLPTVPFPQRWGN